MQNTHGGVLLRNWLREERRTQEWLGEQIGTHQTNVSRWIIGRTPPPLEMALAIEKVTGIQPAEWLVPVDEPSTVKVEPEVEDSSLHGRGAA